MSEQPPPRITHDPTNDQCPNFDSPAFETVLANHSGTRDEALNQLHAAWTAQHDVDVAAWNAQAAADTERLRAEQEARDKADAEARLALEKEAEADRVAAEKKKAKPPTVASGVGPPRNPTVRYSAYAREKMKEYKFIDLFHFHPDITSKVHASARDSDTTFTFSDKNDGPLTLVPMGRSSHIAVIKDKDLTFDQLTVAKTNLIACMEDLKWPEDLIRGHANFYIGLDTHPLRTKLPYGPRVLARYHAAIREEWYNEYALGGTVSWDISIINGDRMNDYNTEIMQEDHWAREATRNRSSSPTRRNSMSRSERHWRGRDDRDFRAEQPARGRSGPANQSFPRGAHSSSVRGACVVCLGRFPHAVQRCRAQFFHNTQTPTRCYRENGDVIDRLTKRILCLFFNLDNGCGGGKPGATHPVHECTGCGSTAHGAQDCPVGKAA